MRTIRGVMIMAKINTVRREGGSRILAVSNVIPTDWQVVELKKIKENSNTVTVKIIKIR